MRTFRYRSGDYETAAADAKPELAKPYGTA